MSVAGGMTQCVPLTGKHTPVLVLQSVLARTSTSRGHVMASIHVIQILVRKAMCKF